MKIAVTGPRGRLGMELVKLGAVPLTSDITFPDKIRQEVQEVAPDVLIHTAAYTDVDGAEEHTEEAFRVNVRGTANVRDAFSGPIIHLSTDYIFDGKHGPYHEKARPTFLNWYGASKMASESMVWPTDKIVRTTLLYGPSEAPDFVKWVLGKYATKQEFFVENCARGNPTYTPHLAESVWKLAMRIKKEPLPHIINIAGKDVLTRFEAAIIIGEVFQKDFDLCYSQSDIAPVRKAKRPEYGGLKTDLATRCHLPIYTFREGLEDLKKHYDS
jgi:dTDP-4-dehydrorhamnose reductase